MLATKVACPSCSTPLRSAQPLPVGKRVRCPRCGRPFTVVEDSPPPTNGVQPPLTPLPFPADAFPPPPPLDGEPVAAPAANRLLLLAVIFGGLFLLAAVSIGLAFLFSSPGPSAPSQDDRHAHSDSTLKTLPEGFPRPQDDSGPRPDRYVPPPNPAPPSRPVLQTTLPPEEQEKVNKALERGVAWLKKGQLPSGSWKRTHPVGCAALPGLTLLECGVPANDDAVQKAARFVREQVAGGRVNQTYDIALVILFLDRLGDPADREVIQKLGVQLIAAQTEAGGWTYTCQNRNKNDTKEMLLALERTRPTTSRELDLEVTPSGEDSKPALDPGIKGTFEAAVRGLPRDLQRVPALRPPTEDYTGFKYTDGSDNSNTQFGLLGVWVAGRYGVPSERSLSLVARRFRVSQGAGGTWAYLYNPNARADNRPSMIAAGLLGLAVGHGLTPEAAAGNAERKKVDDPAIKKSLQALGAHIGKPLGNGRKGKGRGNTLSAINMYFLWSVERVAVLYELPKINDKDWYAWGAEMLVDHQGADGSWDVGGYPGYTDQQRYLVDTCFALLFLKRANLVQDLTNKVEFVIDSK